MISVKMKVVDEGRTLLFVDQESQWWHNSHCQSLSSSTIVDVYEVVLKRNSTEKEVFIGVVHNGVPVSKFNNSFFASATGVDVVIVTGKLSTDGVSVTVLLSY